ARAPSRARVPARRPSRARAGPSTSALHSAAGAEPPPLRDGAPAGGRGGRRRCARRWRRARRCPRRRLRGQSRGDDSEWRTAVTSRVPSLIVHGGAGADPHDGREELREGIAEALRGGWDRLAAGGSSLDAVEAAVCALEDHPRFNAGRGSVLTSAETVEMDASIMEGDGLTNGAVACVSEIRHPGTLARPH